MTALISSNNPRMFLPTGRIAGCLPRKYRPGDICPLAEEHIKIIPRSEWPTYTGKVSLRKFVNEILDQDGAGSCATEATAQAIMIARAMAGQPHVLLNPWFIYHTTSGGRDGGSSIDENLAFVRQYGCAPESVWPRSKGWRAEPSKEAWEAALEFKIEEFYDIGSVDEMVSAELGAFPVVWGANGHALCKVEHLNDREGLDANSWGKEDGDQGFRVWATYNAVNWGYGAYAVRVAKEAA
jgi:hypothetical protein